MATGTQRSADGIEKLAWYLTHQEHGAWDCFSPATQREMVEDDIRAGKQVASVLFAVIITGGLLLSLVTAGIVFWTP